MCFITYKSVTKTITKTGHTSTKLLKFIWALLVYYHEPFPPTIFIVSN